MAETKICGIRTPADLDCAHASGARWIGMVFFHKSPRHLSLDEASTIRHHAEVNAIKTERVALVVNTDDLAMFDAYAIVSEVLTLRLPFYLYSHDNLIIHSMSREGT